MIKYGIVFILGCFLNLPAAAQSVDWFSLEEAQELADRNDKKVMLFAEAEWCGYCRQMNEQVFPDSIVASTLNEYFFPVRLDIESDEEVVFRGITYTEEELSRKFKAYSTPTIIFLDSKGGVIGIQSGFMAVEVFSNLITYVGEDLQDKISYEEFLEQKESVE